MAQGGTSDPYVTVQILERGTGKPVKKEVFKSKTKKKTVDPVFDEASRTPVRPGCAARGIRGNAHANCLCLY
jgi:Ca2+-dependent lipid-binding protein